MRIKRYFAREMRDAIRSVREELGPDAVILSSRRVDDGMEVVAAIDYDESWLQQAASTAGASPAAPAPAPVASPSPSPAAPAPVAERSEPDLEALAAAAAGAPTEPPPVRPPRGADPSLAAVGDELKSLRALLEYQLSGLAWGDFGRRHPRRADLLRRLLEVGLCRQLASQLVESVVDAAEPRAAWRQVLARLVERIPVVANDVISRGGVVALLGPTGVGKTTTVAKLAARYALAHGAHQVALVTTDGYRVGAYEQLRTYAELMEMPLQICRGPDDLATALARFEDRRLVLVDTAGTSPRDARLSEQAALLQDAPATVARYLVLSATTQYLGLDESVRAYSGVPFDGCIVTKVDEATSLGGALSVATLHGLPVAYVGDGQRVPEDLSPARAHRLVSKAVAIAGRSAGRADEESVELVFGGMSANAR